MPHDFQNPLPKFFQTISTPSHPPKRCRSFFWKGDFFSGLVWKSKVTQNYLSLNCLVKRFQEGFKKLTTVVDPAGITTDF